MKRKDSTMFHGDTPLAVPGLSSSPTVGKTLSDIHHSRILYDPPPRIMEIKAKINKWDLI